MTLYGRSEEDPEDDSFLTTHYLVIFWFPLLPLARYRVRRSDGGYAFLGKAPFRPFEQIHLAITLGGLALAFLLR